MKERGPRISKIISEATSSINAGLGDYLKDAELAEAVIDIIDAYGDKGDVRNAISTWLFQTHRIAKPREFILAHEEA